MRCPGPSSALCFAMVSSDERFQAGHAGFAAFKAASMGAPELKMEHLEFGDAWMQGFRRKHPDLEYRQSRKRRTNNAPQYHTKMVYRVDSQQPKGKQYKDFRRDPPVGLSPNFGCRFAHSCCLYG